MSKHRVEWYGIKLEVFIDHYADGNYDVDAMFVCNDQWVSGEELPANMITDRAEGEIYSLVGKALDREGPNFEEPSFSEAPTYRIGSVNC